MAEGYKLHLANTAAIQQYEGLKYTDDHSDARWLAHLLRKRSQIVRQRTTNLLSIQNLLTRNTGSSMSANRVKGLDVQQIDEPLDNPDLALAVKANLSVLSSADEQVELLEKTITQRVQLVPQFSFLKTAPGIGEILALTIMLETGDIRRFASVGNYASYCRCVGSHR